MDLSFLNRDYLEIKMLHTNIKHFILSFILLAFVVLANSYAYAAESKTVVLDVPGMTCKFCPITIRKALYKVKGVIKATAEYETKTATIIYDPEQTNIDALRKATANAGYPSIVKK